MGAIFGVVGSAVPAELNEMGARLAHRGVRAQWWNPASGVYLGANSTDTPTLYGENGRFVVVDRSPFAAPLSEPLELLDWDGMEHPFALAAWDDRSQTLSLARDFVGQKPLHYCPLESGGIAFATEYKALLALSHVKVEADLDSLQYMQCYKRTPSGRTLLRGIHTAPPGALIRLDRSGTVVDRQSMRPLTVDVRSVDEETASRELAHRFVEAIRPLVAGRSRVGISLSGGIDSMSVAYACRQCAPDAELVGYTAGNGADDPEISTASIVMDRLHGRHVPVVVTTEPLVERLPHAVWAFESPVGRTETFQALEIARAAHDDGFDWLMTGMGSDNLFAGMPKHKLLWLSQCVAPLRKDLHEFYALTQSGRAPERPLAQLMNVTYFRGAVPSVPRVRGAQFQPEKPALPASGPEFLNHALASNANDNISRSLVRLERPFQAFGVDFASPFFDRRVMDYAFQLPSRFKIHLGQEKYILRRAMRSLVSPDLLDIPKGISRIRQDAAFAATLWGLSARYLNPDRVRRRGFFEPEDVARVQRSIRRAHYHTEAAMRLWTMIVTEIWAEIYLDQRGRCPDSGKRNIDLNASAVAPMAMAAHPAPRPNMTATNPW
jgi:asparagine synthase (glutamine-hydrolysing)